MSYKRLKIKSPEIKEGLEIALRSGAMPIRDACQAIRMLKGLSQEAFAHSIGVSVRVVKDIEAGGSNPKLSSLQRMAEAAKLKVVIAAPHGSVHIGDMSKRVAEEKASRERDFESVASGLKSGSEVSADNSLGIVGFSYSLPQAI